MTNLCASELDKLADRHLRPDPQGLLINQADRPPGVVLIQIDATLASTPAGQHMSWMLMNLLCRQFKVVEEVLLDVPATKLLHGVAAFGERDTLRETLEECGRVVGGGHVKVGAGQKTAPDIALVIGNLVPNAKVAWRLYADGWRYFVGTAGHELPASPSNARMAIGPYLAACAGAGEVFKSLRGLRAGKGEFATAVFASAWSMTTEESWEALQDGPDTEGLGPLPHFYFAGAGAVTQAAAACMGSSGLKGTCTVVDHDTLDLTNDNRYALSTPLHEGMAKVDIVAMYLNSCGIVTRPVPCRWQDFVRSAGRYSLDANIAQLERDYRFSIVLSCVDKNSVRGDLQRALPQVIFGGSTYGLLAQGAIFDLGRATACLRCHNPPESRNELVSDRKRRLAELNGEERNEYARTVGLSAADVEALLGAAGCGRLSEADLDRFAAEDPQMSVGFVSVAAGVLLTAQFLRYLTLGAKGALAGGALAVNTFGTPRLRVMAKAPDASCDCSSHMREKWQKLWTVSFR